jgi:hypothetical protein
MQNNKMFFRAYAAYTTVREFRSTVDEQCKFTKLELINR